MNVTAEYLPEEPVFTNKYDASGEVKLEGIKSVAGGRNADIAANEFRFQVKDEDSGDIISSGATVTGSVTGTPIDFKAIKYTTKSAPAVPETDTYYGVATGDEFHYSVYEQDTTSAGITIDNTVYKITVKANVQADGTIKLTTTYDDGTEVKTNTQPDGKSLTYVNEYNASGNIELTAKKVLIGKSLADYEFEFELKDSGGTVVSAAKNRADGSITFPALHFTRSDIGKTYEYTMSEKAGTDSHVTYSRDVHSVKVHILDGGSGALNITAEYLPGDPVFTNYYTRRSNGGGGGHSYSGVGGPGDDSTVENPAVVYAADMESMDANGVSVLDANGKKTLAKTGQDWITVLFFALSGTALLGTALFMYLRDRKRHIV